MGGQKGAFWKMSDENSTVLYFLQFPWPSLKAWSLKWRVNRSQRQANRTWVKQRHMFLCCICKRGHSHVVNTCHAQRQMKPCLAILWRIAICQELSLYYLLILRENAPKAEVWRLAFQILHHQWRLGESAVEGWDSRDQRQLASLNFVIAVWVYERLKSHKIAPVGGGEFMEYPQLYLLA